MRILDRIVYRSDVAQVGAFRCPRSDARFRDSGPAERHIVVFPRSAVWIRHAGAPAFVADPNVATIYNRGQEYTRSALCDDGDRCEWFGVPAETAREIAARFDAGAESDPCRPFRHARAPCPPHLYLRQRELFHRLERGDIDPLEAEEAVIGIVADVIGAAYGGRARTGQREVSRDARLALAEAARADIVRHIGSRTTLSEMASRLDVSPFHLCRVFRRTTGLSVHAYRVEIRHRIALELLAGDGPTVSRIAATLGFSSHSHLTASFSQRLGATPSAVRRSMNGLRAGF